MNNLFKMRESVRAYSIKKMEYRQAIRKLDEEVKSGVRNGWVAEEIEGELWREIAASPERKAFMKEAEKIETDKEFELHFRSAFLEFFHGLKISVEQLRMFKRRSDV